MFGTPISTNFAVRFAGAWCSCLRPRGHFRTGRRVWPFARDVTTGSNRSCSMAEEVTEEDVMTPVFTTPQPISVDTNLDRMFSSTTLPPPLPSPSVKPRKTSVADRAQPVVSDISPQALARKLSKAQQRRELMEGMAVSPHQQVDPAPLGDSDDADFARVRSRTQQRSDNEFGDLSPPQPSSPVASSSTLQPSSSAAAVASPSAPAPSSQRAVGSAAAAAPATTGEAPAAASAAAPAVADLRCDRAAPPSEAVDQLTPGSVVMSDEQAWREFVVEENYSVLATKGILQRILEFNESHKAIQMLKMQTLAVEEVDRANDEIHGMDQMEIQRQREKMSIRKKKNKKGADGQNDGAEKSDSDDDDDDDDDEGNNAAGGGGGGGGGGGADPPEGRGSRSKSSELSDDDDEQRSSDVPGSSTESTPEQGVGSEAARPSGKAAKGKKVRAKLKSLFKTDFIAKMGLQMKKHINELCKRDYPRVRFHGRCLVNFMQGEELRRKTEYVSEVTLKNIGVRTAHVKLQQFGTSPPDSLFDLDASPKSFDIAKGKQQVVTFRLVLRSSRAVVREVVGVEIGWREGSKEAKTKDKSSLRFPRRLCIHVSARGEPAVFGVPLAQVEMADWTPSRPDLLAKGAGGKIPRVLVELKEQLVRTGGLLQEGIFRKAPGDVETQKVSG